MDKLPKYIKFFIISQLPSFSNLSYVSKSWYNLINGHELYAYLNSKLYAHLEKPDSFSDKEWYDRVRRSGDVYFTNDKTECIKWKTSNIWKIKRWTGYYLVDIYGKVRFWSYYGDSKYFQSNREYLISPLIDPRWYGLKYNRQYTGRRYNRPILCLENARDIQPTNLTDFILIEHNLYVVGPISALFPPYSYSCETHELILFADNVKSIGGSDDLCFYITNNHDLYYIQADFEYSCLKSIFISKNVQRAFIENLEIQNIIHFITLDGKQWSFTHDTTILPSNYKPTHKSTDLLLSQQIFTKENIIDIIDKYDITLFIYKSIST